MGATRAWRDSQRIWTKYSDAETTAIRKITLVGANYEPGSLDHNASWYGWLSDHDLNWLECSLEYCSQHTIAIAQDFVLTPLNLAYGESQDFLSYPLATDLLIIGHILNEPKEYHAMLTRFYQDDKGLLVSQRHYEPDAWRLAARKSDAWIITTFGVSGFLESELMANKFEQPGYSSAPACPIRNFNRAFEMQTVLKDNVLGTAPRPITLRCRHAF